MKISVRITRLKPASEMGLCKPGELPLQTSSAAFKLESNKTLIHKHTVVEYFQSHKNQAFNHLDFQVDQKLNIP